MTKTTNYQLNQWGENDYVKREDFNADNAKIDAAIRNAIPAGCILLWSGAANAIPAGFALCSGENGTPDLRGRFVVGAGNSDYAVGDTGGAAIEELTYKAQHTGTISVGNYGYSVETHDNRPPFYALCYIMKL